MDEPYKLKTEKYQKNIVPSWCAGIIRKKHIPGWANPHERKATSQNVWRHLGTRVAEVTSYEAETRWMEVRVDGNMHISWFTWSVYFAFACCSNIGNSCQCVVWSSERRKCKTPSTSRPNSELMWPTRAHRSRKNKLGRWDHPKSTWIQLKYTSEGRLLKDRWY